MTHINEDKRKTEGQLVMFDIFNDIDNCPVSSLFATYALYIEVSYNNTYRIYKFIMLLLSVVTDMSKTEVPVSYIYWPLSLTLTSLHNVI
jgi:hypothetical protein